jgi:hypothetical protein
MKFLEAFRPVGGLPGCLFTPLSQKPYSFTLVLGVVFVSGLVYSTATFL